MAWDRVILRGMEFYGYHGALPEEQRLGQPFLVDLEMALDLAPAGTEDDLAQTVNYAAVFQRTADIVQGRTFKLLEALAEAIAVAVLKDFPAVEEVLVRVRKPHVPIPGRLEYAAVEIRRRR